MLAYLKGQVVKKTDKGIILSTGNVGYLVHVSKNISEKTLEKSELEVFIHSHIREDAFDLYGFKYYEELEFFKKLLSINGIGPKAGMELVNAGTENLKKAIDEDSATALSKIPGIGPKLAKRIILELKGKIAEVSKERKHTPIENNDAVKALIKLGYQKAEINEVLNSMPAEIKSSEDVVNFFLKNV
ncbi:MAG: Holliday junction branch migration protein RuvA [Candidatus Gracilibacteria bacterium]|jgi:Holliday junction DNA helicase RuvA